MHRRATLVALAMVDPYRSHEAADAPAQRVIAGPSRLRTVKHLAIIVVLLGVIGWVSTIELGRRMPWLPIVALVPVLADLARTIHEAMLPHRIHADARGLELVWARPAPWRPWMQRHSTAIEWTDLAGVRTSSLSVNGIETTDLHLDRRNGETLIFAHGVFSPHAKTIAQIVLDERDDRVEAPRRLAVDVAGFCSERFATPRTFVVATKVGARALGNAFALAWIVIPGGIAFTMAPSAHLFLTAPSLLVGGILLYAVNSSARSPKVLRLDAAGVSHGPSEGALVLVPWSDIRFARPSIVNGQVIDVRVAIRGAADLDLHGDYGIPLGMLATLLSPPVAEVVRARVRASPPQA